MGKLNKTLTTGDMENNPSKFQSPPKHSGPIDEDIKVAMNAMTIEIQELLVKTIDHVFQPFCEKAHFF